MNTKVEAFIAEYVYERTHQVPETKDISIDQHCTNDGRGEHTIRVVLMDDGHLVDVQIGDAAMEFLVGLKAAFEEAPQPIKQVLDEEGPDRKLTLMSDEQVLKLLKIGATVGEVVAAAKLMGLDWTYVMDTNVGLIVTEQGIDINGMSCINRVLEMSLDELLLERNEIDIYWKMRSDLICNL